MAAKTLVRVGRHELDLTNLDKVLWPESGITKAEMITYYATVAPFMLPHLRRRLLTLVRYPDGISGKSFYQKNLPDYAPAWLKSFPVMSEEAGTINYLVVQEEAALVWGANQGAIELNPSHSRTDRLDRPDWAIVDLDPAEPATYDDVLEVARALRHLLGEFGVHSYPKTSGATGIHVYIPIQRRYTYEQTSRMVGYLGKLLLELLPTKVTTERLIRNRTGKVYVDHLQNLASKTIVAVYSLRPRPGAPVSTPLTWEELFFHRPEDFTLRNVPQRLAAIGDLFRPVLDKVQDHRAVASLVRLALNT